MSNLKEFVKDSYSNAIKQRTQPQQVNQSSCCGPATSNVQIDDLGQSCACAPSTIQVQENLTTPSFGCVVSLAQKAKIKPGDIVVDLGSGAGHDVFEAAKLVGQEGRVVGIDFTPDMINAALKTTMEKGYSNVDFRLSDIEDINVLPDNFADVVISNCVINLSMDKEAVFKEAFRILKPGGRIVDADIIATNSLPSEITNNPEAWCSCLGGALTKEGYSEKMENAGFKDVKVTVFDEFDSMGNRFLNGILEAQKP